MISTSSFINLEYTPDNISTLEDYQVFVFGSNLKGIHGKGAAECAFRKDLFPLKGKGGLIGKWAVYYVGSGFMQGYEGKSYAIPTKVDPFDKYGMPLDTIEPYIDTFISFARSNLDLQFLVTKIGCGYAGYTEKQMSKLWKDRYIPDNVVLPKGWKDAN